MIDPNMPTRLDELPANAPATLQAEFGGDVEAITDEEIDELVQHALKTLSLTSTDEVEPPKPRPSRGVWYIAVFLLGMTVVEGIRVLTPVTAAERGWMDSPRCGAAVPASDISQLVASDG